MIEKRINIQSGSKKIKRTQAAATRERKKGKMLHSLSSVNFVNAFLLYFIVVGAVLHILFSYHLNCCRLAQTLVNESYSKDTSNTVDCSSFHHVLLGYIYVYIFQITLANTLTELMLN